MCGRYSLYSEEKVFSLFNIIIKKNYNISPGKNVLILDNKLKPKFLQWGIKTDWLANKLIVNARLETLNIKKIFSEYKRCIFIADGYIEWKIFKKNKLPYFHYLENNMICMAGIYNDKYCCIVTVYSNKKLQFVHNRKPLVLDYNFARNWVNNNFVKEEFICDPISY